LNVVQLVARPANNHVGEGPLSSPFYDTASTTRTNMAKNTNTFEKRRREMEKKRKADEKRERRHARRKGDDKPEESLAPPVEGESPAPPVEGE
jgi:hypothetical protein